MSGEATPRHSDPAPASRYMPVNASPNFAALLTNLQKVINALTVHPAFVHAMEACPPGQPPPNSEQNKVYYKRSMLLQVDPEVKDDKAKEAFREVYERCMTASMMMNDTSAKTSMMLGENPGEAIDFGPDVKDATKELEKKLPDEVRDSIYAQSLRAAASSFPDENTGSGRNAFRATIDVGERGRQLADEESNLGRDVLNPEGQGIHRQGSNFSGGWGIQLGVYAPRTADRCGCTGTSLQRVFPTQPQSEAFSNMIQNPKWKS
ncbi:MAG: hypothetical protein Q9162_001306 [Coniocarpon cinnabarinum]